ncbi:hypothetical protein ABW20_dc0102702 [Dactylellina cionopaga]|nr:hypothetical protein ABW20_dc0102702 [Dactylellina cionopaga]
MQSVSGNKRRKLTPDQDSRSGREDGREDGATDSESLDDEGSVGNRGDEVARDRYDSDSGEQDNSDTQDDKSTNENEKDNEETEVIIPVAEEYDSEESETGMADSLEKMRKTVEEIPHAPGAIVKVQLENFVTYTKVTFEPGPSLNMVIGPNGTGKSTLVCAICLGLGFGPEFLPQDRVVEFAGLGPIPLLRETQRAAAPPEVLKDHEALKKLRSLEVNLEVELDTDREALTTLEKRQQLLERDVARLRERQAVQEHIKLLENTIPFVQYQNCRADRDILKKEYAKCREQLKEIRKEQEPQTKQIEEAEGIRDELRQWIKEERTSLDSTERDLKTEKETKIEALKIKETEADSKLTVLIDTEKERKVKIDRVKKRILQFEKSLEDDPGPVDTSAYNKDIV